MPHTPGPYVKHPSREGFRISTPVGTQLADVPPYGWAARNKLGRATIEANANLFAAAPVMMLALQAVALDTSIDPDLQVLVQHAIDVATKGTTLTP